MSGDIAKYTVEIANLGDLPAVVGVSQTANLAMSTWEIEQPFPALINLDALPGAVLEPGQRYSKDGDNGFAVLAERGSVAGLVGGGDFNADGFHDLYLQQFDETTESLSHVILFGSAMEKPDVTIEEHLALGGLKFDVPLNATGSQGDFNGDGVDDLLISLPHEGIESARTHIVFGSPNLESIPKLDDLDGANGFTIFNTNSTDGFRQQAFNAGDVNGDGIDDIYFPVETADPDDFEIAFVYGTASPKAFVDSIDLDGQDGFILGQDRITPTGEGGFLAAIGDINGDGLSEFYNGILRRIILGSTSRDAYIIAEDLTDTDLIEAGSDFRYRSVGDINGDGNVDVFVGSREGSRIVFGSSEGDLNLDTTEVLTLVRPEPYYSRSAFGELVTSGDINGDGLTDLIIADHFGYPFGAEFEELDPDRNVLEPGMVYVFFGSHELPEQIDLRLDLDGGNGFVVQGFHGDSLFGSSIAVGDFNGDGVDDLAIDAPLASSPRNSMSGATQVIFGRPEKLTGSGNIDASVRLLPEMTLNFLVEGELPPDETFSTDVSVSVEAGRPDTNLDNNTATIELSHSPMLPGDANGDGSTNFQDFLILANNFGKEDAVFANGDFDGDGRVSFLDFLGLAENFGKSL